MNISIIIPAYNEEDNLKILLPQLHGIVSTLNTDYELIVIDALKSVDNSEEICKKYNAVYIRQKKLGYADAFHTGIRNSQHEAILVVDSDNSQDISAIPKMYDALINGNDVVIGSRYVSGGKTDDPLSSVIMSKILNYTYRILLGFKEKDISTDFRFYKKSMLENIVTECTNFDVIEETLFHLKRNCPALRVKEIPIHYRKRAEGVSKRKLIEFIIGYIRLLFRLLKLRIKKKG